jgi:hypothetical protein
MKNTHSSYWLSDWENDDIIVENLNDVERKSLDLYKLASAKRAISNFVNIVTNDSIPVVYNTRGDSYTDGKTVVIGAKVVEPKDFDVAVGLALHEGSHIKLSDFDLLRNLSSLIPNYVTEGAIKKGIYNSNEIIKNLWNYVEDRRIDQFVFSSAPGYRDYYRAMYDKYFNDRVIDKGLLSDEYTDETIESYMFRIINLHNKNTDLTKLKGLREIYKLVGLNTISRLKSSNDTFEVALEIFKVILKTLTPVPQGDDTQESQSQNGDGDGENGDGNGENSTQLELSDETNDEMGGMGVSAQGMKGNQSSQSNTNPKEELSERQKELLSKKIQKQKDFMDGDIQKKTISRKDQENLDAIQESGSEIKSVGNGVDNGWGNYPQKGIDCIVVKKLTRSLFESELFPMTHKNYWRADEGPVQVRYQEEVDAGIKLGTILGRKLQVRGEDRSTVFNRQKVGKIDKRMIASLGFGNENVFQFTEIDSYKKANLHVSVDASGSMNGEKWQQTLTNVVALCKAVDMIQNLTIQVSFRGCSNGKPYVVLAYDSRTDKFSKVKQMFPAFDTFGTTPEGLAFEAIMKEFLPSNNDLDSYFLNLSDGEPYFHGKGYYYGGYPAEQHTRKMVKQIEGMGVKTLSYFVGGQYDGDSSMKAFRTMYGKGASFISVTNLTQITKTMNQLFLQK